MQDTDFDGHPSTAMRCTPARTLSGNDIESLLRLLVELKDMTLSRASYQSAATLIAALGGQDDAGSAMLGD
jgi:hypothetical protein